MADKLKNANQSDRKVTYPGSLAKPVHIYSRIAAAMGGDLDWDKRHLETHLALLLQHYKITLGDGWHWYRLALSLARDHVPAFKTTTAKRRGRPSKHVPQSSELTVGTAFKLGLIKGLPGRPKKHTDESQIILLKVVKKLCTRNGWSGRGAISKALNYLIMEHERRTGTPFSHHEKKKTLLLWRKRYTAAVNKFPELKINQC